MRRTFVLPAAGGCHITLGLPVDVAPKAVLLPVLASASAAPAVIAACLAEERPAVPLTLALAACAAVAPAVLLLPCVVVAVASRCESLSMIGRLLSLVGAACPAWNLSCAAADAAVCTGAPSLPPRRPAGSQSVCSESTTCYWHDYTVCYHPLVQPAQLGICPVLPLMLRLLELPACPLDALQAATMFIKGKLCNQTLPLLS